MTPAVASLIALGGAIALSMSSRLNVGWVAISAAWLIGVYLAGLKPDAVIAGFPVSLFVTLAGVTLLFSIAETNGTLERLAHRAVALVRGNHRWLPLLFFGLSCTLSSVGPGAISSVALLIPLAIVIGRRVGMSPLLTSLMVANGANAGNLSPISSVGVIANSKMAEAGLIGVAGHVWFANFAAHLLVAVAAWLLFATPAAAAPRDGASAASTPAASTQRLSNAHRLTVAVIVCWVIGVTVFKLSLGLSAFVAVTLLLVARVGDEAAAVRNVPWNVIMMVCGVSVLIALLEKTGGMELFTSLLARIASPSSLNGVIALITGAISSWSSTSGVVLPAFLPTVQGLVDRVGGGDPLAVALSINVGSALVDVTPLSTLGALCVAAVTDPAESRRLFRQLMTWGFTMIGVGALLCQLFIGWIARA